jgi:hypothetical protein
MSKRRRRRGSPKSKNRAYWMFKMEMFKKQTESLLKEIEEQDRIFEEAYFQQMKQVFNEKPHLAEGYSKMEDLKELYPRVHQEAVDTVEYLKFQRHRGQKLAEEQIIKDLN